MRPVLQKNMVAAYALGGIVCPRVVVALMQDIMGLYAKTTYWFSRRLRAFPQRSSAVLSCSHRYGKSTNT